MNEYLIYWKNQKYYEDMGSEPMDHAPSNQFRKMGIGRDDILWVIMLKERRMYLLGRLEVGQVVQGTAKAERILGKTLWPGKYHAIAKRKTERSMTFLDMTRFAPRLRFAGKSDRLPRHFDGRSFQAIRRLTQDSAVKLTKFWHSNGESTPPRKENTRITTESKRQGRLISPEVRKKIDTYAMEHAKRYFKKKGFRVEDKSSTNPYDLHCEKRGEEIFVEVKGTRSKGKSVILTAKEVNFARNKLAKMALFIVHSVNVNKKDEEIYVHGGKHRIIKPWDVGRGTLKPTEYNYTPKI